MHKQKPNRTQPKQKQTEHNQNKKQTQHNKNKKEINNTFFIDTHFWLCHSFLVMSLISGYVTHFWVSL